MAWHNDKTLTITPNTLQAAKNEMSNILQHKHNYGQADVSKV